MAGSKDKKWNEIVICLWQRKEKVLSSKIDNEEYVYLFGQKQNLYLKFKMFLRTKCSLMLSDNNDPLDPS